MKACAAPSPRGTAGSAPPATGCCRRHQETAGSRRAAWRSRARGRAAATRASMRCRAHARSPAPARPSTAPPPRHPRAPDRCTSAQTPRRRARCRRRRGPVPPEQWKEQVRALRAARSSRGQSRLAHSPSPSARAAAPGAARRRQPAGAPRWGWSAARRDRARSGRLPLARPIRRPQPASSPSSLLSSARDPPHRPLQASAAGAGVNAQALPRGAAGSWHARSGRSCPAPASARAAHR